MDKTSIMQPAVAIFRYHRTLAKRPFQRERTAQKNLPHHRLDDNIDAIPSRLVRGIVSSMIVVINWELRGIPYHPKERDDPRNLSAFCLKHEHCRATTVGISTRSRDGAPRMYPNDNQNDGGEQ